MLRLVLSFLTCFLLAAATAQPRTDSVLFSILKSNRDTLFQRVLQQPDTFRLQIIYTQINRDHHNQPRFTHYYFHYDPKQYFNPASMVKMPLAFLALEKVNTLRQSGVNKYTTIQFDSSRPWQRPLYKDTTAANGLPSLAHLVKRAFLVSENDPYNRFYQFVGQETINRRLQEMGYTDARITRQFMGLTPEQNRYTNGLRFLDRDGRTVYTQPPAYNADSFDFSHPILLGKAHFDRNDSLVQGPFDFTAHNALSLQTLQQLLQSVLFPQSVLEQQRFALTHEDHQFLYRYLSQFPSETPDPKYDTTIFYDSYAKFFFRNPTHRLPPGVRVFNKVGWAYGFLTDVSYVVDHNRGVEFMLAATLYVNSDGVINDGRYDYTAVGWPFLYQLGQTIYRYEQKRKRHFSPNLSAFRLPYEHRDPADKRPSLKDVDN